MWEIIGVWIIFFCEIPFWQSCTHVCIPYSRIAKYTVQLQTPTNMHVHSIEDSQRMVVSIIKQHITMTTFLKQLKMPEKITWQPMTVCTVCFCKTGSTFFYQIVYLLFAYCSHVSMCFWISLSRIYLGPLMMKNWLNFCIKNWMRGHIHFRLYLHMMGEHRNPTGSWGNLTPHEILKKWQF